MVNVKPHLKYVLLSPFLFLILLGLGFQLDLGIVKISATTLAIYFAFGIFVGDSLGKADHFVTRLPLVSAGVLFALVGFFSIIGLIVGNNVGDIKEDSFGFVHFLLYGYRQRRFIEHRHGGHYVSDRRRAGRRTGTSRRCGPRCAGSSPSRSRSTR